MPTVQGDLGLLNEPVAQRLLQSRIPARLAYVWADGTPRVVPIGVSLEWPRARAGHIIGRPEGQSAGRRHTGGVPELAGALRDRSSQRGPGGARLAQCR
jgi:hypothetical protein